MTTIWHPNPICVDPAQRLPVYGPSDLIHIADDRWFWDFAPVIDVTGATYREGDAEYWLALTAPASDDPDHRHFIASLAVLQFSAGTWNYVGDLQLRDTHPGNREWAGMAVVNEKKLIAYFTSAGLRDTPGSGYQQRLWAATVSQSALEHPESCLEWTQVDEVVSADEGPYLIADQAAGEPGLINAFRDPFLVSDSGADYVVFSASSAQVDSKWNGCIGLAKRDELSGRWEHLAPLIQSEGTSTELERAHIIRIDDLYYLFWSTPSYTFSPEVSGPTGLYGAVSDCIDGGYRLLNDSGLVVANPASRPSQDYSWYVTQDLRVQGFVDLPRKGTAIEEQAWFAGTASVPFSLRLDGDRTRLEFFR